jgi:hypothetical protein
MYEFRVKDYGREEHLKLMADHAVREIKETAGWDADVQVNIEPEARSRGVYAVSISVFALGDQITVKKRGRHVHAVFKKARKAALRRIHQISDQRTTFRRKTLVREPFAS